MTCGWNVGARAALRRAAPAEYFEARVSVHVVAVPDNLNKLAAVVTRARIVSEFSVVILVRLPPM